METLSKENNINTKSFIFLIAIILSFNVHSQNTIEILNGETFTSKIGSICEETTEPDPCAGQEIYLTLKFNKKKVTITEMYISSCEQKYISYKLEYKWELINTNEIKIYCNSEETEYKSIRNMKFKIKNDQIFGSKINPNNKMVEYVFNKPK